MISRPHTNSDWNRRIHAAAGLKHPNAVPHVEGTVQPVVLLDDLTTVIDPGSLRRFAMANLGGITTAAQFFTAVFVNPAGSGYYARLRKLNFGSSVSQEFRISIPSSEPATITQKAGYMGVDRGANGLQLISSMGFDLSTPAAAFMSSSEIGRFRILANTGNEFDMNGFVVAPGQFWGIETIASGTMTPSGYLVFEEIPVSRQ